MNSPKLQVLICDDEEKRENRWAKALSSLDFIKKNCTLITPDNSALVNAISALEDRRRTARKKGHTEGDAEGSLFDAADILVIDYDLIDLDRDLYFTGESIAYLARCYSACGPIIGLNQFGDNHFDLTLTGHPESFADINIGSKQLHNPGLWESDWKGFRPWSWPSIPKMVQQLGSRQKDLQDLEAKVLKHLGLAQFSKLLSANAVEYLGRKYRGSTKQVTSMSFNDFVNDSGHGYQRKDKPFSTACTRRIAASRISKWLERLILPNQDILVDAPHLVERFPSLLSGDAKSLDSWNKTTEFSAINRLGIRYQAIEKYRFDKDDWISRPCWFWPKLSDSKDIAEVKDPWSAKYYDFVFCEDISRFASESKARQFLAGVDSQFVKRFLIDPSKKGNAKLQDELRRVSFQPQSRLAM